ncbi:MAG: hypothetical protein EBR73_17525 [Rhodobacteraceae bacterium]|nr:hypothetical protein [Paracoccaceae bacterium]
MESFSVMRQAPSLKLPVVEAKQVAQELVLRVPQTQLHRKISFKQLRNTMAFYQLPKVLDKIKVAPLFAQLMTTRNLRSVLSLKRSRMLNLKHRLEWMKI